MPGHDRPRRHRASASAGVNIASAAVGYAPEDGDDGVAVMVVTTDQAVAQDVIDSIVATEGFLDGRTVSLS